jgi:4'-phosphopantetheinyl transferase EntD
MMPSLAIYGSSWQSKRSQKMPIDSPYSSNRPPASFPAAPAVLSPGIQSLFTAGVVAVEMRVPGDLKALLPEEVPFVSASVPKRVQEFAAGRQCARRALREFGIADFPLRMASTRAPIWPETLTGSITHTTGFCAVVVASRQSVSALGLDSELVGSVATALWPRICGPVESAWVATLAPEKQASAVSMIFSAKEAVYKCRYVQSGERLGFHDITVSVSAWGGSAGEFEVNLAGRPWVTGRYRFHEEFISAGVGSGAW